MAKPGKNNKNKNKQDEQDISTDAWGAASQTVSESTNTNAEWFGVPNPATHQEGAFAYQGDPSDFGLQGAIAQQQNPQYSPLAWLDPLQSYDEGYSPEGWAGYAWSANGTAAIYTKGDEWLPRSWGPDSIYEIQTALDEMGILSGGYTSSVWDEKSASAFAKILGAANGAGMTWQEVLNRGMSIAQAKAAASRGGGGGGGGGGGAAAITDEDISALAQKVAQGILGRDLRPEELASFIPAFRNVYASGTTAQVGAENIIRKEVAPQGEADAHQVGNVMNVLAKLLGG